MPSNRFLCRAFLPALMLASVSTVPLRADSADDIKKLWEDADPEVSLLYRFGFFDDDLARFDGAASTLQTLVSVQTGKAFGLSGYAQLRNVSAIGDEDFNSTINGRTAFPVEPDPEATEIDQAYLTYEGIDNLSISAGRKKLNFGNQRFVSQVGWRQNHQSFDGVFVDADPLDNLKLTYAYAFNVNRIFTGDSPIGDIGGDTHLANLEYSIPELGKVTAYGYWLNFNEAFSRGIQTRTLGANLTGSQKLDDITFGYVIEAAHQTDISDNPNDINLGYYRLEPKITWKGLALRGGVEVLSGNGRQGFQAPLSLLHAYNGFADRFLTTPADGLEDIYIEAAYKFGGDTVLNGLRAVVAYHEFRASETNDEYGTEWNMLITKRLFGRVNALLKLAIYDANGFSEDVTKLWFQISTKF